MELFSKKKNIVGIDIGSSSIKMVELKETKKGFQLMNYGIAPLAAETIVDGAIMDSSAVVEAVRGLIKSKKVKTKDAAISISGHSVIIKKINMAAMSEDELAESIQWEAEQYIPFPIADVNIDFHILGVVPDQPQMDVLIVAAKKDMINDYTAVITEAGLIPVVVDVDSFAVENTYCINYDYEQDEVVALINIGANVTNINILKGGMSTLTRDVLVGGRQITNEIQKQLGVSFEDAEALKCGQSTAGMDPGEVENAVISASGSLVAEVQRSIDFYLSTTHETRMDKILLSGGSSKLKGIDTIIAERVGITTEMLDPFRKVLFNKSFDVGAIKSDASSLCVCVGLATRKPGDK